MQALMSEFGARLVHQHLAVALFHWKQWSSSIKDALHILSLSAVCPSGTGTGTRTLD